MNPVDQLRILAETFTEPDDDAARTALGELLEALADDLASGARATAAGHDELLRLAWRVGEAVPVDGAREPL